MKEKSWLRACNLDFLGPSPKLSIGSKTLWRHTIAKTGNIKPDCMWDKRTKSCQRPEH